MTQNLDQKHRDKPGNAVGNLCCVIYAIFSLIIVISFGLEPFIIIELIIGIIGFGSYYICLYRDPLKVKTDETRDDINRFIGR